MCIHSTKFHREAAAIVAADNAPRNALGQPYDTLDLTSDAKRIVIIAREPANHVETLIGNDIAGMSEMHLPFALTAARRLEKLIEQAHAGAVALAPAEFARIMGRAA